MMENGRPRILAISPFLWTMGPGSGVPTLFQTLDHFGEWADVRLLMPGRRTCTLRRGRIDIHCFRLPGWSRWLDFGPDRSIFSHTFRGGHAGRYVLDKLLWCHFLLEAGRHGRRLAASFRPHVYYGVTPYGAPVALMLRLVLGGVNVTRLLGTFLARCAEFGDTLAGRLRRAAWLIPHWTEALAFQLPAGAVVVTDDGTRGEQVGRLLRPGGVLCWRNGIHAPDEEQLREKPACRDLLRRRYGIPDGTLTGLYTGQLVRWKRLDRLLAACKLLSNEEPAVFLIVGDGPERAALEAECARLGVARQVRFCGALPQDRLGEYLLGSDFFVCPHDLTCACNSTYEAMAAALPVVATSFGESGKLIRDGVEGILLAENTPDALAAAIRGIAADPARRAALGERARGRILAELGTWRDRARREFEVIEDLVRRKGPAPALGEAGRA